MDILLENQSEWIVLRVRGRLDAFNYELLANRLRTLNRAGKKKVVIDLTNVHLNMVSAKLLGSQALQFKESGGCLKVVTQLERTREMLLAFSKPGALEIYSDMKSVQDV